MIGSQFGSETIQPGQHRPKSQLLNRRQKFCKSRTLNSAMERLGEAEKLNSAGDTDGAIKIYDGVCHFVASYDFDFLSWLFACSAVSSSSTHTHCICKHVFTAVLTISNGVPIFYTVVGKSR